MTPEASLGVLQERFPAAYSEFLKVILEDIALFEVKNHDYASGGDPLGNLDRCASIMEKYPNFPYATRRGMIVFHALKQFDALLWMLCRGTEAKCEDPTKRAQDISIYMDLFRCPE
jgi:hypothetical protein